MKVPCIFDNRYKKLKDIKMRFSVFGKFLGAGLIVALLATSCLTSKDNEYTPERERRSEERRVGKQCKYTWSAYH